MAQSIADPERDHAARIGVKMTVNERRALEDVARDEGRPLSTVVRAALRRYLAARDREGGR